MGVMDQFLFYCLALLPACLPTATYATLASRARQPAPTTCHTAHALASTYHAAPTTSTTYLLPYTAYCAAIFSSSPTRSTHNAAARQRAAQRDSRILTSCCLLCQPRLLLYLLYCNNVSPCLLPHVLSRASRISDALSASYISRIRHMVLPTPSLAFFLSLSAIAVCSAALLPLPCTLRALFLPAALLAPYTEDGMPVPGLLLFAAALLYFYMPACAAVAQRRLAARHFMPRAQYAGLSLVPQRLLAALLRSRGNIRAASAGAPLHAAP